MTPPPLPPGTPSQTEGLNETPAAVDAGGGTRPEAEMSRSQGPAAGPGTADSAPIPEEAAPVWRELEESLRRKNTPAASEPPALRWREVFAVLLLVVLTDLTVYRGQGYAGYAALFLIAPGLLFLGSPFRRLGRGGWIVAGMTVLLAGRMLWLGSALEVAVGLALLVASAMALAGRRLYVLDIAAYALQTVTAGGAGIVHYAASGSQLSPRAVRVPWLSILLPLAALALFGTLFVLANPDLVTALLDVVNRGMHSLSEWIRQLSLTWTEVILWLVTAWVAIGLLRPVVARAVLARFTSGEDAARDGAAAPAESPLYPALRNTLAALIVLFAVYLVFEFKTLWFRVFPKGFYYAGYAHEGAAWLTASLALATILLSAIFRGRVLCDPRLPRLRRLAWIWSAENLVLAATVYNRLWIYVAFNGMTRMRSVAVFGVSAVVAGVVLVIWKIAGNRDFVWLLRRQLAALALAIYLFALTPIDALVHTYNVRRVLAGDLAPSVQISVHPIDAEGILALPPLLESDNEILREGIRAMLAERTIHLDRSALEESQHHWTAFQFADRLLSERLHAMRAAWEPYLSATKRAAALDRFDEYVYQWY